MLGRSSSPTSGSSSTSSAGFDQRSSTAASSWSSGGAFDLLEPVESSLPHDIVELSFKVSSTHRHHHHHRESAKCSLVVDSTMSPFSFPRNHTMRVRCPKHGIVHDPALALPRRDSRSLSSGSCGSISSASSYSSAADSTCSQRSLKCTLKRVLSFKRP